MRFPTLTTSQLTLLTAAFIALFFNIEFWQKLIALLEPITLSDLPFLGAFAIFLFAVIYFMCHLFSIGKAQKIWLALVLISSSSAAFYQMQYHVLFNKTVVRSILGTDYSESAGLLSSSMIIWIFILGVIPSLLIIIWPIQPNSWRTKIFEYGLGYLFAFGVAAFALLAFYKDFSTLFRNHREIRSIAIPSSFLYSTYGVVRDQWHNLGKPLELLGQDATLGAAWQINKPVLFILVVGETARSANFSLGGYTHLTNPKLAHQDIIFFNHTTSCGTATAESLPCMFAQDTRTQFDLTDNQHHENLLDLLMHTGLKVDWLDNNGGGCKGVCARTPYYEVHPDPNNVRCQGHNCYDMALLDALPQRLQKGVHGQFIVLHQKGSHGPSYFERSPSEHKHFWPECRTNQLQRCTTEEIINAYDNSLVYTDYVLNELILQLVDLQDEFDVAMLYVSDHGESLGENGFYLHGLPYRIAPKEQIEIPMLLWASLGYKTRFGLDWACLKAKAHLPLSHDHLFSSLLAILNIKTNSYTTALDLTSPCQSKKPS
jgi:lipid A ethanolaminephosphotransferase